MAQGGERAERIQSPRRRWNIVLAQIRAATERLKSTTTPSPGLFLYYWRASVQRRALIERDPTHALHQVAKKGTVRP